jgi:hypoxanthine-DNA glycosylase
MVASNGFEPIVLDNARVLVLGTMPGVASLCKQQYYAHPRNAFWPIMAALYGIDAAADYQVRKETLLNHGVAVWDVLQSCNRNGSLDAKIDMVSIGINDFSSFFVNYSSIRQIFFNGRTAEKLYKKHVLPFLDQRVAGIECKCLPSTSPAYAALGLEQKIEAWKVIKT